MKANSVSATIGQFKVIFSFDPTMIPLPPEVILLAPVAYTIEDHATLTARVTPKAGATITLLKLNGLTVPATPGDSTYPITLINGLNTFTLVATDSTGRSGSATITRDNALPQLAITSPANGATIVASSINVLGTVSSAIPLRSVTVNGVRASVNVGTFGTLNVSLIIGANTITATATDILDKLATASITVTGQPPGPLTAVVVTATPAVGPASLIVRFNVVATVPGTIQLVTYDFEGYGKNLFAATHPSRPYLCRGRNHFSPDYDPFPNKTDPAVPLAGRLRVDITGGADSPHDAWSRIRSVWQQVISRRLATA